MKKFNHLFFSPLFIAVLISGCGGSSGGNETGKVVTLADYLIPNETVSYTVTDFEYRNGELDFEDNYIVRDEVVGSTVTSFEDGFGTDSITLTDNQIIITDAENPTINFSWPSMVNEGQKVVQTIIVSQLQLQLPVTLTTTFTAVLDSFAMRTPTQTFTSYGDVLQINIELRATNGNRTSIDQSIIYYARDIGAIGTYDRDCYIGDDAITSDNSSECDEVEELYGVRMN